MSITLLIHVEADKRPVERDIKSSEFFISVGRHPTNLICLPQKFISRFQCWFSKREGRWIISDGDVVAVSGDPHLWSSYGTFLNGKNIKESFDVFLLRNKDVITFGTAVDNAIPRIIFQDNTASDEFSIDHPTSSHNYE